MDALAARLGFAPDGKLERLCLAGCPNLLHEWAWDVDLGGKSFRPAGWDECFPTIDPYADSPVMGELIGQPPEMIWRTESVEQIWRSTGFEARRRFTLTSASCLQMTFQVTNRQAAPREFLWASHALFGSKNLLAAQLPNGVSLIGFAPDGSERKLFVANAGPVELTYQTYRVLLTTDQPWWGVWINRGGWPAASPEPLCCLGVEATNTPGEQPDGQWLATDAPFCGKVKLEIDSERTAG
jgi:hypothetical protein